MWRWEAHGRVLRLVLARSGPTWPEQAGRRRRAAPRGAESLKPVDYYSADSEFQNQPDSEPSTRCYSTTVIIQAPV